MKTRNITIGLKLVLPTLLVLSCAEERPDTWGTNGEEQNIFSIEEINKTVVTAKTSSEVKPVSSDMVYTASFENPTVTVANSNAPDKFKPLIKDLELTASPSQDVTLAFSVDKKFLTAFKKLDEQGALSTQEAMLAKSDSDKALLKVFQYEVVSFGTVIKQKNALEEETNQLKLEETSWEEATHVKITAKPEKKKKAVADLDDAKQVFLKDKLNGAILSRADIQSMLGIHLSASDDSLFMVKVGKESLMFFEISGKKKLSKTESEIIGAGGNAEIGACSDDIIKNSPFSLDATDCFSVLRFKVALQAVLAEYSKDAEGIESAEITYTPVVPGKSFDLIKVEEHAEPKPINVSEDFFKNDPRNLLKVADVGQSEFLMRRTLEDSPNNFNYAFAGASGELEIVKFVFKKDTMEVVRVDPLVQFDAGIGGNTEADNGLMMSFPVSYKKKVTHDAAGQLLDRPDFQDAQHSDAGAMALVDWSVNLVPPVSSPLDYYSGVAQYCFSGTLDIAVSKLDNRLSSQGKGVLNFTNTARIAGNSFFSCGDNIQSSYFDKTDMIYTFKERVSFKHHKLIAEQKEEEPELSLPLSAQKKFGFGLFTYKKKKPDQNGQTHVKGTEIALPSLIDIKDGKQFHYILKGLPGDDGKAISAEQSLIRAAITQGTKEVIADINVAYRKALEGTSQQRRSDVIKLSVVGEDMTVEESGQLGDLDRNYIYYVDKQTNSGIIGLGGSHANPRSGKVESASVFLYGGNMLGMVKSLKKLALASMEYQQLTQFQVEEVKDADDTVEPQLNDEAAEKLQEIKVALSKLSDKYGIDATKISEAMLKQGQKALGDKAIEKDISIHKHKLESNFNLGADLDLAAIKKSLGQKKESKLLGLRNSFENARTANRHSKTGTWHSHGQLSAHFAHDHREKTPHADVVKSMEEAHLCARSFDTQMAAVIATQMGKTRLTEEFQSDLMWLVAAWKPTLAHEIGHNMGLRHNFKGSFDKGNHSPVELVVDPENDVKITLGTYSSVMDYLTDDHITYTGLGKHDVASLRFAYTGLVELKDEIKQFVETDENGNTILKLGDTLALNVVDGKHIHVEDYKSILGLQHWEDFNSTQAGRLPIVKDYMFCSDEDVSLDPTCNRFDSGTSPQEIVEFYSGMYKQTYSLNNFPGDRIRFNGYATGSYVGRLFQRMIPIRQMLEETFYQLIANPTGNPDAYVDYLQAAMAGMAFFQEVVQTPADPGISAGYGRFKPYTDVLQGGDGKDYKVTFNVERKRAQDVGWDLDSSKISQRGIELDKAVALILLTERDMGFPRYESMSLRLSFADLERMLKDSADSDPTDDFDYDLTTLPLLKNIMADNVSAQGATPIGTIQLDNTFNVEVTELVRIYALLGAVMSLDVGEDADFNHSLQYKVKQAFTAPADRASISRPETTEDAHFFASMDAPLSTDMIKTGSVAQGLMNADRGSALGAKMSQWYTLATSENPDQDQLAALEEEVNGMLQVEDRSDKLNTMNQVAGFMDEVVQLSQMLQMYEPFFSPTDFAEIIDDVKNQVTSIAKTQPAAGLGVASLDASEGGLNLPILGAVQARGTVGLQESLIHANSQALHDFRKMLHPHAD